MRASNTARRRAGLDMTPMIDMAFLLITFFVMTLRLTASQEEVNLPRADQAQTTHESKLAIVTIVVDEEGRILSDGRVRSVAEIGERLRDGLAGGAEVKVVIRADARSPFAQVRRVMRLAAENGIEKLSISALKLGEEAS